KEASGKNIHLTKATPSAPPLSHIVIQPLFTSEPKLSRLPEMDSRQSSLQLKDRSAQPRSIKGGPDETVCDLRCHSFAGVWKILRPTTHTANAESNAYSSTN